MPITIQIIDDVRHECTPHQDDFTRWVNCALLSETTATEVSICLVSKIKSAELNEQYRHKIGPTNVLTFDYPAMPGIPAEILGDLIICSEVVITEAQAQNKPIQAHWAHLTIHGMLHLQGYDHETESEAQQMEQLETKLLQRLGYADPYE